MQNSTIHTGRRSEARLGFSSYTVGVGAMPVGERLGAPACFFGRSKPLPYRHTLNLSLSVGTTIGRPRAFTERPYDVRREPQSLPLSGKAFDINTILPKRKGREIAKISRPFFFTSTASVSTEALFSYYFFFLSGIKNINTRELIRSIIG